MDGKIRQSGAILSFRLGRIAFASLLIIGIPIAVATKPVVARGSLGVEETGQNIGSISSPQKLFEVNHTSPIADSGNAQIRQGRHLNDQLDRSNTAIFGSAGNLIQTDTNIEEVDHFKVPQPTAVGTGLAFLVCLAVVRYFHRRKYRTF